MPVGEGMQENLLGITSHSQENLLGITSHSMLRTFLNRRVFSLKLSPSKVNLISNPGRRRMDGNIYAESSKSG